MGAVDCTRSEFEGESGASPELILPRIAVLGDSAPTLGQLARHLLCGLIRLPLRWLVSTRHTLAR